MKEILLTRGLITIVDDGDYEALEKYNWYADETRHAFYARRRISGTGSKTIKVSMHRIITSCPQDKEVDHKNGCTLDNRRTNLRVCDHLQNGRNLRRERKGKKSSPYKGVHKHPDGWTANITINYQGKYLGYFKNEIEAAQAYDGAARKYFGEFARLNFDTNAPI